MRTIIRAGSLFAQDRSSQANNESPLRGTASETFSHNTSAQRDIYTALPPSESWVSLRKNRAEAKILSVTQSGPKLPLGSASFPQPSHIIISKAAA